MKAVGRPEVSQPESVLPPPRHLQGDLTASTKTELLRTFIGLHQNAVTRAVTVSSCLVKFYLLHLISENSFPPPR